MDAYKLKHLIFEEFTIDSYDYVSAILKNILYKLQKKSISLK